MRAICQAIEEASGEGTGLVCIAISGGCINNALRLETSQAPIS